MEEMIRSLFKNVINVDLPNPFPRITYAQAMFRYGSDKPDLRVTLEGTENRITVARNRYIKTVQDYNVLARSFPTNLTAMMFSYAVKPSFTVQNEAQISAPPVVDFGKK